MITDYIDRLGQYLEVCNVNGASVPGQAETTQTSEPVEPIDLRSLIGKQPPPRR